ncbi:MAG: site-specific DNA-methyltransferase [Myxococcota bacterium]|nr:site-specific DNA-methyltransferase [Myxococcota bacterium]
MNSTTLTAQEIEEIARCIEWGLPLPAKFADFFGGATSSPEQKNSKVQELLCLGSGENGVLLAGDNLAAIKWVKSNYPQPIKLIYIDPPFDVGTDFHIPIRLPNGLPIPHVAYSDTWGEGSHSFIHMLAPRLKAMVELLDDTGSIVVHCDYRTVVPIRLMLDRFLGPKCFRNEIVWHYTGGGRAKKYFSRKHDSLLWYSKSDSYTFNIDAIRVPYKTTSGYARNGIVAKSGKRYQPNPKGTPVDDVWDIPIINPMAKERLGYPTQKPAALLERIICALSQEGDCVADFFCGSGTTLAVADRLNRRWLGVDRSPASISTTLFRLSKSAFRIFEIKTPPFNGILHPKKAVQVNVRLRRDSTGMILNVSAFKAHSMLGLSPDSFQIKSHLLYDLHGQCLMNDSVDWIHGWMIRASTTGKCLAQGVGRPEDILLPNLLDGGLQLMLIDIAGGFHLRDLDVNHV